MKKLLSASLAVLFLSACMAYNGQHSSTLSYSDLQHHNFVLRTFNGQQITPQNPNKQPNLEFNENQQVSGTVCNSFRGAATMSGNIIKANMASTRMMCPDANLNAAEQALHKAFSEGARLSLSGQTLSIRHGGNVFIYQLRDYVR